MPAIDLVVKKGRLEPASMRDVAEIRRLGLTIGESVTARIMRSRSAGFMRLAHRIGRVVRENVDGGQHMTDHDAIKRLQWESGVECERMAVRMPDVGMVEVRMPRSISYDSMDEDRFRLMIRSLCEYIVEEYWPECSPGQIERMAEVLIE